MIPHNPNVVETTFSRSLSQKLSRRIWLHPDLAYQVREERNLVEGVEKNGVLLAHINSYSREAGWTHCWFNVRRACEQAKSVEIIKRTHPTLGKFILFRVWKDRNPE